MGYRLAALEAGSTRSAKEPKAFFPAGLTERNPSRWRRSKGSAESLERRRTAWTASFRPRSSSKDLAESSRNTAQWTSGS